MCVCVSGVCLFNSFNMCDFTGNTDRDHRLNTSGKLKKEPKKTKRRSRCYCS